MGISPTYHIRGNLLWLYVSVNHFTSLLATILILSHERFNN